MTKTLRELANDFARGKLEKEEYRKERRKLLQGIVAGEIEVLEHSNIHALISLDDDGDVTQKGITFDPNATTQLNPTINKKQSEKDDQTQPKEAFSGISFNYSKNVYTDNDQQKLIIALSTLIVAICLCLIAFLLFMTKEESSPMVSDVSNTHSNKTRSNKQPEINPATQLLSSFINTGDWREQAIENFKTSWSKFNLEQRNQALTSPLSSRLKKAINDQLAQEKALLSLGGSEQDIQRLETKQQTLHQFAESFGIYIPH